MKFLFCGFGNIMQRHFRNLKKLLPDCLIDVYISKRDKYRIFDDKLNISYTNNLSYIYDINNIFYDIEDKFYTNYLPEEALDFDNYDAVFIGTLPPKRIDIAIKAAKRGFNLFIEKPLSNNLDKIYKLQEIVENNNLKCAIGFQMRFHPLLQTVKDMVDNNKFGEIYRIEVTHGNNIHNWTNGRDLNNFYVLDEKSGGGALLSQIHEIDYLTWIFGKHYPISAIYGQWLEGNNSDVEDNISIMSKLEVGEKCVPIIINLDFLSKIPTRKLKIYGTDNTIEVDLMEGSYKTPKETGITTLEWNDFFYNEMEAFINLLNGEKQENLATLEDGIASLEYVMDIKDNMIKV